MEDILFSVFLYGVVFSFLCWLTTPTTTTSDATTTVIANSTTSDTATVAVANSSQPVKAKSTFTNSENQHKAKTRAASARTTQTPPKAPQPPQSVLTLSQLKAAFAVEPDPDSEVPVTPAQKMLPPIDSKAIDKLKLRQARKIASQLGIRQKINGKDQPLSWLRSQIKQRIKTDTEVAVPIIRANLAAS